MQLSSAAYLHAAPEISNLHSRLWKMEVSVERDAVTQAESFGSVLRDKLLLQIERTSQVLHESCWDAIKAQK